MHDRPVAAPALQDELEIAAVDVTDQSCAGAPGDARQRHVAQEAGPRAGDRHVDRVGFHASHRAPKSAR